MKAREYFQKGINAFQVGDMAAAERHFRMVIKLNPSDAQAHLRLAYSISSPQRTQEALEETKTAVKLDPRFTSAYGLLSSLYQRLGHFDDAIASCEKAISLDPDLIPPYATIVKCKRIQPSDADFVGRMEKLLARKTRTPIERLILHYALGKSYDDLGEFESAYRHFEQANLLGQRAFEGKIHYDTTKEEQDIDLLIRSFSALRLAELARSGSDSHVPVFVVGMLRSGTTLLDSLLSRHAEVDSAGEVYFWKRESEGLMAKLREETLSPIACGALAKPFLNILAESGKDASRMIDKMPLNFRYLGFIYAAFPKAKVIHIRRHPVDTCISLYTTQFATFPPDFGFQKSNIVHAYRQYLRLMEHWRSVLPPDFLVETDYEAVIENRDETIGGLLERLGVASESVDLNSPGPLEVFTPSLWQVRQPIYRSSMDRWKNYEPWLGEFAELLPDRF